ncbi:LysR family transcriptional regulator [Citrobacter youngae]|nr:LysR family transcriptional regulator [Citrobacter youngae]
MTVLMSRKLKYFIVSFETRCINLAAEKLCVTRSPLTRVLYELEGMMGDKLFNRRYNQLEPTELACSLYEELKPTYDLLCGVENKFNSSNRMSALELLCDLSVPYVLYQHILIKLKTLHPGIVCRRVFVSNDEIKSLSLNPQTILLSFRKIDMPEGFTLQSEGDDSVFLLAPGHLSEEEMKDFDTMKDIILYIRKDILSSETKGFVTNALKHFLPYVKIQ